MHDYYDDPIGNYYARKRLEMIRAHQELEEYKRRPREQQDYEELRRLQERYEQACYVGD